MNNTIYLLHSARVFTLTHFTNLCFLKGVEVAYPTPGVAKTYQCSLGMCENQILPMYNNISPVKAADSGGEGS